MSDIKSEKTWLKYTTEKGDNYIITSKEMDRSLYFLYRLNGSKYEKVGKNKDPTKLEEMIK